MERDCAQGRVIMMLQTFYTLKYTAKHTHTHTQLHTLTRTRMFKIFGYENVAKINIQQLQQQ